MPRRHNGNTGRIGGHAEILGIERRKAAIGLVAALALAAGAVALLGQIADFGKLLEAVKKADKAWIPLMVGGQLLAYAGYVIAYRDFARVREGPVLPYWTATRVVAVGFGAYVLASAAGGLAVDYWALHRAGERPHRAARRVLALNAAEWGILGTWAALAGIAVALGWGDGVPIAMWLAWLVVVPACVAAALWVSSPARAERLASLHVEEAPADRGVDVRAWLAWAGAKLRAGFADGVGSVVFVRAVFGQPHRYPGGVAGFAVYWCGDLFTLYAGLRAFGAGHVAVPALVLAYATGYVATALPLPAGGSGGIEASLALSLHLAGVDLVPAVLGVLVYRLVTFWLPLLPALTLLPLLPRLNDELPRLAHARA